MKETIAIALSGGVDSLTAAYILKEKGYPLIGLHFITGFESPSIQPDHPLNPNASAVPLFSAKQKAAALEAILGIPVNLIDVRQEFKENVVDYFIREYRAGKTPNPCLVCNAKIKFGVLLNAAQKMGAARLATGHYADKITCKDGHSHLFRGDDPVKDQSYFLAFLDPHQLDCACFPLGKMRKTEVLSLAKEKGLHPAAESESQDICFIKDPSYSDFLTRQQGFEPQPGLIVDVNGNVLGEHSGLHRFTVGQRKGINRPAKAPYYVVRMEPEENRLVVGFEKDVLSTTCVVAGINWISKPCEFPVSVDTQVRYRHRPARSILTLVDDCTATIRFDEPQTAVTPGQGAVFYQDDEVIGGGWIE